MNHLMWNAFMFIMLASGGIIIVLRVVSLDAETIEPSPMVQMVEEKCKHYTDAEYDYDVCVKAVIARIDLQKRMQKKRSGWDAASKVEEELGID